MGRSVRRAPRASLQGARKINEQLSSLGNPGVAADIHSGRITGLLVPGSKRVPQIPNVPSFVEVGLPNFEARHWLGLFMPAGSPREASQHSCAKIKKVGEMFAKLAPRPQ